MTILNSDQRKRALEVMRDYLAAPKNPDGTTPREVQIERDKLRDQLIDEELKPLTEGYFAGHLSMDDFKLRVDGINKRHEYWGFKGVKGQMFFNMVCQLKCFNHSETIQLVG